MQKLIICLSALLISCATQKSYTVSDFTDSVFTAGIEGPMYKDGNIYVVNFQKEGTIGLVKPDGACELFIELPAGSTGNGIRFNSRGDMLIADYSAHNVLKVDMKTKQLSIYAHDSAMNQPNDLAILRNDIVFCSDPDWKNGEGKLWRVNTDGTTTLLMDHIGTTNGIEVSPDQKYLFVNESIQRKIWRYDINEKGELLNKKLLITFEDGGLDGMKCDSQGNLWIARYDKGAVLELTSDGVVKKEVKLKGQKPTNLTFSADGKTVFVTMQDRRLIEKFEME
ncbi:MAG TPA: SMP-30/gluconolactonase/LRE family protein [Cytophagaceae bacterium]|nr:SMP-30/gluconolactonase/LRE family protein [Cytophagaceae bacterium]